MIEWRHLHDRWLELKAQLTPTTGIKKLDAVLELLFGKPHESNWRNYKLFPANEEKFVVLRTTVASITLPTHKEYPDVEPAPGYACQIEESV